MKLSWEKAKGLLIKYKIPVSKAYYINNENELRKLLKKVGFPCVLKIDSPKIIHRTEVGAVKINLYNLDEVKKAYNELKKFKAKILIQEQVGGIEVIIGLKEDIVFGKVVLFGLGGVFVEALKDVSIRVCPITRKDALQMINEIKAHKIFEEFRGIKIKKEVIINTLVKVSRIKEKIKEMDINPFIVNNKTGKAVDIRVIT